MSVGQENQIIQAGASAQPLVTSAADVVTPDAVNQLTDSFRKGFITADDVIQRIGDVGQANKKSMLESLKEHVSPQAINARMSAYGAAGAQNQLATAQATAAEPLVQPLAGKEAEDIQQARSERLSKQAVDAWTQWNLPVYKTNPETGEPTKDLDYDAMARGGVAYVRAQNALAFSSHMLQGTWADLKDPKTGQPRRVYMNANGEDVTPVPGNKAFEFYNQMRRDAWSTFHSEPGQAPAGTSGVVAPSGHPDAISDPAPAGMITQEGQGASAPAAPDVVAAPSAAAVPAPEDAVQPYAPMTGLPAGPGNTVWDEAKVTDELSKNPIYQNWANTRTQIGNFTSAAKAINAVPLDKQATTNLNPQDTSLAESLIKMYDPQGVIREFKWDKYVHNQPLAARLQGAMQTILQNGQFAPSVRQDLIKLGQETIKAREEGVKPVLQQAVQRASSNSNNDIKNILDSKDLALLGGGSLSDDVGNPGQQLGSTPAGPVQTINGKSVYRGVDGKFYLAH